jgi:hypothetical protein
MNVELFSDTASSRLVGTAAPDYTLRMCNTCRITGRESATEEGHELNNAVKSSASGHRCCFTSTNSAISCVREKNTVKNKRDGQNFAYLVISGSRLHAES